MWVGGGGGWGGDVSRRGEGGGTFGGGGSIFHVYFSFVLTLRMCWCRMILCL
jgi:hypothetical protein